MGSEIPAPREPKPSTLEYASAPEEYQSNDRWNVFLTASDFFQFLFATTFILVLREPYAVYGVACLCLPAIPFWFGGVVLMSVIGKRWRADHRGLVKVSLIAHALSATVFFGLCLMALSR